MEMQNQLRNSQSCFVEEIQLQFQALASDIKKLVQFDIPITNEMKLVWILWSLNVQVVGVGIPNLAK
jgi:hypothetical protein